MFKFTHERILKAQFLIFQKYKSGKKKRDMYTEPKDLYLSLYFKDRPDILLNETQFKKANFEDKGLIHRYYSHKSTRKITTNLHRISHP